jgi:hypothetical protein
MPRQVAGTPNHQWPLPSSDEIKSVDIRYPGSIPCKRGSIKRRQRSLRPLRRQGACHWTPDCGPSSRGAYAVGADGSRAAAHRNALPFGTLPLPLASSAPGHWILGPPLCRCLPLWNRAANQSLESGVCKTHQPLGGDRTAGSLRELSAVHQDKPSADHLPARAALLLCSGLTGCPGHPAPGSGRSGGGASFFCVL